MAQEWQVIAGFANSLTVVTVLVIIIYVIVGGKLNTAQHTTDVTTALKQGHEAQVETLKEQLAAVNAERDRAVTRENEARRELSENNAVLARLETTVRGALDALARRR